MPRPNIVASSRGPGAPTRPSAGSSPPLTSTSKSPHLIVNGSVIGAELREAVAGAHRELGHGGGLPALPQFPENPDMRVGTYPKVSFLLGMRIHPRAYIRILRIGPHGHRLFRSA
jgi:hypothetical protein